MTTEKQFSRRRHWLRRCFIFSGCVLGLGVLFYFVATSSTFFQQIVLPKLSQRIQAEVTVRDASIHPFSEIVLRDLKVRATGALPLLEAREAKFHYGLREILKGNIRIDEAVLEQAKINLVLYADGSNNWDSLAKGSGANKREGNPDSKSDQPLQVWIKQAGLRQSVVNLTRESTEGSSRTIVLSNLNLSLNNLRNGGAGTFNLSAGILAQTTSPETNGHLTALLQGKFGFDLDERLQPINAQGRTEVFVENANGPWEDMNQLQSAIDCQITQSEIRQLALSFKQQGASLGVIQVSGPFDFARQEGNLQLTVHGVDQRLLNLTGLNLDFGSTAISSTNQVQIRDRSVQLSGQMHLPQFSLNGKRSSTPALDLAANYKAALDPLGGAVRVEQFGLKIALPPTPRAVNTLELTGRVDLAGAEGMSGHLTLSAESLDLTMFHEKSQGAPDEALESLPEESQTSRAEPPTEPPPIDLPTKAVSVEIKIGQLFFHDLAVSNWVAQVRLTPHRVEINPARLLVGGAPVELRADLDLGTPGYAYDFHFDAQSIPIEPLANSFFDVRPGAYKGDLIALVDLKGIGTTGPNLRRNLAGHASLALTNADFELVSPFFQGFLAPIGQLIGVPDLVQTPLNHILFDGTVRDGQIQVEQCQVQSSLFSADTSGAAPIADPILRSPLSGWPMRFALRRGLAERVHLVSSQGTSEYIDLPNFIQVTGTLEAPKPKLELKALATSGLEALAGKEGKELKGKVGELFKRLIKEPKAPKDQE